MREIVLDTETTGLDPLNGDRIVEIGCLELEHHVPTGARFHEYVNPERFVSEGALRIHGLSNEMLAGKPTFGLIADRLLAFLGDAPLIIHNAEFDMAFLNAELERCRREPLPFSRAVDTLRLARQAFPGAPASLDALCKRFGVDNSARDLHGALLDAGLLAEVYLELKGGRQPVLIGTPEFIRSETISGAATPARVRPAPLAPRIREDERLAHAVFVTQALGAGAIWRKYGLPSENQALASA